MQLKDIVKQDLCIVGIHSPSTSENYSVQTQAHKYLGDLRVAINHYTENTINEVWNSVGAMVHLKPITGYSD